MPETGGIDATEAQQVPPEINTHVPQSARVYDYWLGGKDHFPADRALGEAIAEALPTIRTQVRAQRAFLGRAVRYLARDAEVRQFLDIGTGIPSAGNVHDVAQEIAPESRVLYVDNDPIVLGHARALMAGTPEGTVAFIQADLREPEAILGDPAVARTIDLAQPVGLVLIGVMHHLRDDDDPRRIVATLVEALAPGSYLVLSQSTPTSTRTRWARWPRRPNRAASPTCPAASPTPSRSSPAWSWSSPAWCRWRPGGPTPAPIRTRGASTPTAGSPANPRGPVE
jgi:SAM-dependent methyltransferase